MYSFQKIHSHPPIQLPPTYPVFDLTYRKDADEVEKHPYGIGRYNENRAGMYPGPLYDGKRTIHVGIDIFCPVNSPVFCPIQGRIFLFGYNEKAFDYGYTLITEHELLNQKIYCLFGHLSAKSIENKSVGQTVQAGELIGWIGNRSENGNWTPHLHIQLGIEPPKVPDMPGVVSEALLADALIKHPDPRILLGPIYL